MKKYTATLSQILVTGIIILTGFAVNLPAQIISPTQSEAIEDHRPFDFSDKYYEANGVEPALIANRRNGQDELSVFDFIRDERFRNVRITGTFPAYDRDGNILFWNLYGNLYEESFLQSPTGEEAKSIANRYPIFTFPSETVRNSDRQAVIIETDDAYFEKNVLGLGVIISVEYTDNIHTKEGKKILDDLAAKNGLSLDDTPIIKTINEINFLRRMELIKQTIRGTDDRSQPPYAIAKILDNLQKGAVTPDAFLLYVTRPNSNKPLPAEEFFVTNFECLKRENELCSEK